VEVGRELWESGFSPKLVLGAIGAGVGANMTARLLMSPGFARWLYALPQAGRNAPSPGYMAQRIAGSLAMLGRGNSEIAGAGPAIARSLGLPFTDQTPVRLSHAVGDYLSDAGREHAESPHDESNRNDNHGEIKD
jgi:hypothetical protein